MNSNTVVCPLFHLPLPLFPSGFSPSVHLLTLRLKTAAPVLGKCRRYSNGEYSFSLHHKTHWWVCCITSIKSLSCLLMANTPELLLPKYCCCRCCKAKQCVRSMFCILKLFKGAQRGWLQIITFFLLCILVH